MSRDSHFVVDGLTYLECPRWRDGRLLVVSMRDRKLMRRGGRWLTRRAR